MVSQEVLNENVKDLKLLMSQVESLNERIESIKDFLKKEMEEQGVSELKGDDWKVTWKSVQSNRFSQSEFKQENEELYQKYLRMSESKRFTVK